MMKRVSSLLIILSLILVACNNKPATSEKSSNTEVLDSLFVAAIAHHEIPAAAVYLSYQGKEIYNKAFGWKNIEENQELQVSDIFRIASMTKSVTAVATLQLVEKGLLKLDDPVSKYISEFKDPVVLIEVLPDSSFTSRPAVGEITIQHLLTHTSGIGYGFQSDKYNALVIKNGITEGFEERPIGLQENTRRIARLPLFHDPGDDWTYSLSFDVLGAVIEVVSSESLDTYYYNHIFLPLGMNDTYFYLPEDKAERLVTVYEHAPNRDDFILTTYPLTQYPVQGAKTYLSGGADLSSTTKDLAIFAQMLLNKGSYNGKRVLGEKYVDMMTSKQSEHGWWDSEIGFGPSITTKAGAVVKPQAENSFEFGGFYDTFCWVDPSNELVAILLLQMYPNNEFDVHYKFRTLAYKCLEDY